MRSRPRASSDPFFDKPYEPDPSADPSWESKGGAGAAAPVATSAGSSTSSNLSRYIKPRRKVAMLLGGSGTTGTSAGSAAGNGTGTGSSGSTSR